MLNLRFYAPAGLPRGSSLAGFLPKSWQSAWVDRPARSTLPSQQRIHASNNNSNHNRQASMEVAYLGHFSEGQF
jgi:hypothetical protein